MNILVDKNRFTNLNGLVITPKAVVDLRERFLELFEYDAENGKLFWKVSRGPVSAGDEAGSFDGYGYRCVKIDGRIHKSHRIIFLLEHGFLPKFIDHFSQNPSNNRISNLRAVTQSKNMRNKRMYKNNKSGHAGVHRLPNGKWAARAYSPETGKQFSLGDFTDIEDAIKARNDYIATIPGYTLRHGR
jgi:hypothetical protein